MAEAATQPIQGSGQFSLQSCENCKQVGLPGLLGVCLVCSQQPVVCIHCHLRDPATVNHKYQSLADASQSERQRLKSRCLTNLSQTRAEDVSKTLSDVTLLQKQVEERHAEIRDSITGSLEKLKKEICDHLDSAKEVLVQHAHDATKAKLEAILSFQTALEEEMKQVKQDTERLDWIVDSGSDQQVLEEGRALEARILRVCENRSEQEIRVANDLRYNLSPALASAMRSLVHAISGLVRDPFGDKNVHERPSHAEQAGEEQPSAAEEDSKSEQTADRKKGSQPAFRQPISLSFLSAAALAASSPTLTSSSSSLPTGEDGEVALPSPLLSALSAQSSDHIPKLEHHGRSSASPGRMRSSPKYPLRSSFGSSSSSSSSLSSASSSSSSGSSSSSSSSSPHGDSSSADRPRTPTSSAKKRKRLTTKPVKVTRCTCGIILTDEDFDVSAGSASETEVGDHEAFHRRNKAARVRFLEEYGYTHDRAIRKVVKTLKSNRPKAEKAQAPKAKKSRSKSKSKNRGGGGGGGGGGSKSSRNKRRKLLPPVSARYELKRTPGPVKDGQFPKRMSVCLRKLARQSEEESAVLGDESDHEDELEREGARGLSQSEPHAARLLSELSRPNGVAPAVQGGPIWRVREEREEESDGEADSEEEGEADGEEEGQGEDEEDEEGEVGEAEEEEEEDEEGRTTTREASISARALQFRPAS